MIKKNLPQTGLDIDSLPNIDWLYNVIHSLDPKDTHNLFSLAIPIEKTLERDVNPVYILLYPNPRFAKLVQQEPAGKQGRGYFRMTTEERKVIKLEKIARKIIKKDIKLKFIKSRSKAK